MRKRILTGVLAAGMAFSAFAASAAGLGVTSAPLQVGVTQDLSCDADGVDVLVHFADQEPGDGRGSNGVDVNGISTDCDGAFVTVLAVDAAGDELGRITREIDAENMRLTPWTDDNQNPIDPLDPLLIEGVEVHING